MAEAVDDDDFAPWPSRLYRDLVAELVRFGRRKTGLHPEAMLESSAFAILLCLSDGRARTLRELSGELDLEQSTVNRQVNAAIKLGFLERFHVAGSHSGLIRPTAAGTQAFVHDGELRVVRLEAVFADLAPGDPEILLTQLLAFNDAYERTLHREGRRQSVDDRDHRQA